MYEFRKSHVVAPPLRTRLTRKVAFIACLCSMLHVAAADAGVECISGDAARDAFVTANPEPYFSLLQPREMAAKTGGPIPGGTLQKQREAVRSTYLGAVLDCTPEDLEGLESYVSIIDSSLRPSYPGLVSLPWRFIKVRNEIEGGLPHTRANAIIFSESLLKSIARSAQKKQWKLGLMNIIIHEQIHVVQRIEAPAFAKLYEQWGFRRASAIRGAEDWLATHQIVNPDGIDVMWVWKVPGTARTIWPRVILAGENPAPTMPDDFLMVGIELVPADIGYSVSTDENNVPRFRELSAEVEYTNKFEGVTSLYHPNEIAADYLADLALWDCLIDKNTVPAEQKLAMDRRLNPMRIWARQTFATK